LSLLPSEPRLIGDARRLGVTLDSGQAARLEAFAELLGKWNRHFNLLSRRDLERLWARHVLDSLSVADLLRGATVDIGSGGGFPGVPLAVARPDLTFVLVDRHQRKCRFLEQVAGTLDLANVDVRCADIATLHEELHERFGTAVSRAVADPPTVKDLATPLLEPGGSLVLLAATRGQSLALPAGARREVRRIPGLERPHEVVIIVKTPAGG
jgi:16S rRNA (guanine527-N7)-methyltransferase